MQERRTQDTGQITKYKIQGTWDRTHRVRDEGIRGIEQTGYRDTYWMQDSVIVPLGSNPSTEIRIIRHNFLPWSKYQKSHRDIPCRIAVHVSGWENSNATPVVKQYIKQLMIKVPRGTETWHRGGGIFELIMELVTENRAVTERGRWISYMSIEYRGPHLRKTLYFPLLYMDCCIARTKTSIETAYPKTAE